MFALVHWRKSSADDLQSEWKIETQDLGPVEFPSDNELSALFKEHLSAPSDVSVIERGENHLVIQTPAGLMRPDHCLLKAIWNKSTFK